MTKAIIIAAGMGTRLRPLTNNCPKAMLPIGNKTIIQNQIKIYKSLGIQNISIIVGYKKEKFRKIKANFFYNKNFKKNNILESLFFAKSKISGNCIISYSDIIFKKSVVKKLLNSKDMIALVTDISWKKMYKGRTMHPISEAEKTYLNKKCEIKRIGKNINLSRANSEFIGLLKLNAQGCKIFKKYYSLAKSKFLKKRFFSSKTLTTAYITDFISFLIKNNIIIKGIKIKGSWMEIDTIEDYLKALNFFRKN